MSVYKNFIKRVLDFIISLLGIIVLSPFLILFSIIGYFKMNGNPYFIQLRPGKDGKIFKLLKFRSMSNKKDEFGNYLPDNVRLTKYGKWIRSSSIDEILELFNILKGDMSFVGPRPFLVKDIVFMDDETMRRHSVRPGLTGLAQVNGRNNMPWEEKFVYDLDYVDNISFLLDAKIFVKTVLKVTGIIKTSDNEVDISVDYGDYLLNKNLINKTEYETKLIKAKKIESEYI